MQVPQATPVRKVTLATLVTPETTVLVVPEALGGTQAQRVTPEMQAALVTLVTPETMGLRVMVARGALRVTPVMLGQRVALAEAEAEAEAAEVGLDHPPIPRSTQLRVRRVTRVLGRQPLTAMAAAQVLLVF